MSLRRLLCLLLLVSSAARAATPPLLDQAIQKLMANEHHWAYTRTTQWLNKAGKPDGGPTVECYDPSQPYARQWQLVQYDGRAPTAFNLGEWRREKEREIKHTEKSLGEVLDLEHAALAGETPTAAIFQVPILKGASRRFPADKLIVYMQVDKTLGALTSFSLRPREQIRIAAVVRVEDAQIDGRFGIVEPQYAPALLWAKGAGTVRVLGLITLGRGAEMTFGGFRRVTPYDDRFTVKIGDVKALDF